MIKLFFVLKYVAKDTLEFQGMNVTRKANIRRRMIHRYVQIVRCLTCKVNFYSSRYLLKEISGSFRLPIENRKGPIMMLEMMSLSQVKNTNYLNHKNLSDTNE